MLTRAALLAFCLLPAMALSPGCTKPVDLERAIQLTDVTSGWYDVGVVNGRNKIVPSVTFRLRKTDPSLDIPPVSVNALFRAADGAESDLDNDVFLQRIEFQGEQTASITIRAENGYTAEAPQSRADMLKHSQFRDMRVRFYAKQAASQWVDIGAIDVQRQLLTR